MPGTTIPIEALKFVLANIMYLIVGDFGTVCIFFPVTRKNLSIFFTFCLLVSHILYLRYLSFILILHIYGWNALTLGFSFFPKINPTPNTYCWKLPLQYVILFFACHYICFHWPWYSLGHSLNLVNGFNQREGKLNPPHGAEMLMSMGNIFWGGINWIVSGNGLSEVQINIEVKYHKEPYYEIYATFVNTPVPT